MSVDETIRSQADYLDALAAAIRTVNGRLDSLTRTDLEARLGVGGPVHTNLGPVPSALFGQSGPAHTLGNALPFIAQANIIADPAFQGIPQVAVNVGTSEQAIGEYQAAGDGVATAWFATKSAASVATASLTIGLARMDDDNPFSGNEAVLRLLASGSGTHELMLRSVAYVPGYVAAPPFLMAAVKIRQAFAVDLTNVTSRTAIIELFDATAAVVRASTSIDLLASQEGTLSAAYLVPSGQYFNSWHWRLRWVVVTTGAASIQVVDVGEPQLQWAFSPDPGPFAPQLGRWQPERLVALRAPLSTSALLRARVSGDSDDRLRVLASGTQLLGSGAAAPDIAIARSATKELTVDNNAAGAITLKIVGRRVAVPKAVQTVVAGTAIVADYELVQLNSTGNVTMTAAPTIADGIDGQMLTLLNVDSADTITLQDQGTLANSNLRLMAAAVAIGPRGSIQLVYSATIGDWVQSGNLVVTL